MKSKNKDASNVFFFSFLWGIIASALIFFGQNVGINFHIAIDCLIVLASIAGGYISYDISGFCEDAKSVGETVFGKVADKDSWVIRKENTLNYVKDAFLLMAILFCIALTISSYIFVVKYIFQITSSSVDGIFFLMFVLVSITGFGIFAFMTPLFMICTLIGIKIPTFSHNGFDWQFTKYCFKLFLKVSAFVLPFLLLYTIYKHRKMFLRFFQLLLAKTCCDGRIATAIGVLLCVSGEYIAFSNGFLPVIGSVAASSVTALVFHHRKAWAQKFMLVYGRYRRIEDGKLENKFYMY